METKITDSMRRAYREELYSLIHTVQELQSRLNLPHDRYPSETIRQNVMAFEQIKFSKLESYKEKMQLKINGLKQEQERLMTQYKEALQSSLNDDFTHSPAQQLAAITEYHRYCVKAIKFLEICGYNEAGLALLKERLKESRKKISVCLVMFKTKRYDNDVFVHEVMLLLKEDRLKPALSLILDKKCQENGIPTHDELFQVSETPFKWIELMLAKGKPYKHRHAMKRILRHINGDFNKKLR